MLANQETRTSAGDTSAAKSHVDSSYAWYVLALLCVAYSLNWIDRYLFVVSMESIKRDLELSDTALGLLSGVAFSLVYSLAGLVTARIADARGRRNLLAGGIALWSAMTAVCGASFNFVQLFFARMGVGIGESACSPAAHSLISDYFTQRHRATAIAIYGLGLYVGLTTGLWFGGWIIEAYSWRVAFLAAGIPGVFFAVVFWLTVKEPVRGSADLAATDRQHYSVLAVLRYMMSNRTFVCYVLGSGLFVLGGNCLDSWAAVFLMRIHGLDSAQAGATIGAMGGIAGMIGTMVFALLADRLSGRDIRWYLWISAIGGTLCVPASLIFWFSDGWLQMVSYFIGILMGASYMAPTIAITQRLVPVRMRAVSSAVILLSYNIVGLGLGNLLVGGISDLLVPVYGQESLRYSLALVTLAALAGLVLTLYATARMPKDFANQIFNGTSKA